MNNEYGSFVLAHGALEAVADWPSILPRLLVRVQAVMANRERRGAGN